MRRARRSASVLAYEYGRWRSVLVSFQWLSSKLSGHRQQVFRLPGIRGIADGGVDVEAAFEELPDHPRRDVAVGARD